MLPLEAGLEIRRRGRLARGDAPLDEGGDQRQHRLLVPVVVGAGENAREQRRLGVPLDRLQQEAELERGSRRQTPERPPQPPVRHAVAERDAAERDRGGDGRLGACEPGAGLEGDAGLGERLRSPRELLVLRHLVGVRILPEPLGDRPRRLARGRGDRLLPRLLLAAAHRRRPYGTPAAAGRPARGRPGVPQLDGVRSLVPPDPPHGEAAEDERPEEGERAEPARDAAVEERADIGDDQQRPAVEHRPRARGPRADLLPPLAPEQEDEERDGQEEGDLEQDRSGHQGRVEVEHDHRERDQDEDEEPADGRIDAVPEASHEAVR